MIRLTPEQIEDPELEVVDTFLVGRELEREAHRTDGTLVDVLNRHRRGDEAGAVGPDQLQLRLADVVVGILIVDLPVDGRLHTYIACIRRVFQVPNLGWIIATAD